MAGSILFSCDTAGFMALAARLTGKEMRRAKRKALQKGSSIIVRQTRKEIKQSGFTYRKGMEKAIISRTHTTGTKATIHLFGNHSLSGKDRGIMRYLEVGTRERYRSVKHSYRKGMRVAKTIKGRKKGYSGKIKEYRFFARAQEISKKPVTDVIRETIKNEITKINNLK